MSEWFDEPSRDSDDRWTILRNNSSIKIAVDSAGRPSYAILWARGIIDLPRMITIRPEQFLADTFDRCLTALFREEGHPFYRRLVLGELYPKVLSSLDKLEDVFSARGRYN